MESTAIDLPVYVVDTSVVARRHLNNPLVHADRNLKNALSGRFAQEIWIEDYRPA